MVIRVHNLFTTLMAKDLCCSIGDDLEYYMITTQFFLEAKNHVEDQTQEVRNSRPPKHW